MIQKKVCVIGLGYIGLPTAALLASHRFQVAGVDTKSNVVEIVNKGGIHIVEHDLEVFVRSAVINGYLKAFNEPQESDVYMICVPTPFHTGTETPEPNIDFVLGAIESIAQLLKAGDMVILESTSPVGTTQKMAGLLSERGVNISEINLAYCPERVLPGNIMNELVENDRIIGGLTPEATEVVSEFYQTFVKGKILGTDAKTAEMCKLTENSFRDINIAFANELSMICEDHNINVWDLIRLANHHPRVNILQPGAGVGGHCIAVDPWFIVASNPSTAKLIRQAREVNKEKTRWVCSKIIEAATQLEAEKKKPVVVACFGLAFKPNIDDLRESPAVEVAQALTKLGIDVIIVEPNIESHKNFVLHSIEDALNIADISVVLVRHKEFEEEKVKVRLRALNALDYCGALS